MQPARPVRRAPGRAASFGPGPCDVCTSAPRLVLCVDCGAHACASCAARHRCVDAGLSAPFRAPGPAARRGARAAARLLDAVRRGFAYLRARLAARARAKRV